eukprot:CAMPEP_0170617150 /NCGR_PEP_ID=MMETSP0224-20130122/26255_1 /TAXON_ID=285029 /ORGANISM="Togula jolla, Strain CCCM 725" /LENGTH=46 /DNA_ID= /DNA_START= /DNA_END= /DNA_ORIENTATION=
MAAQPPVRLEFVLPVLEVQTSDLQQALNTAATTMTTTAEAVTAEAP